MVLLANLTASRVRFDPSGWPFAGLALSLVAPALVPPSCLAALPLALRVLLEERRGRPAIGPRGRRLSSRPGALRARARSCLLPQRWSSAGQFRTRVRGEVPSACKGTLTMNR